MSLAVAPEPYLEALGSHLARERGILAFGSKVGSRSK